MRCPTRLTYSYCVGIFLSHFLKLDNLFFFAKIIKDLEFTI